MATVDGKVRQAYKESETADRTRPPRPRLGRGRPAPEGPGRGGPARRHPDARGLAGAMTPVERRDLVRFLIDLGKPGIVAARRAARGWPTPRPSSPTTAPRSTRVADPTGKHPVNRDRLYDFYAKEAEHFAKLAEVPSLLPQFPGLDGGKLGHWGNQNEDTWADDRWNKTDLGNLLSGVFRGAGVTVPKGVCVRLGDKGEVAACFNPETLTYDAVWTGGFVKFAAKRHGFLDGLLIDGTPLPQPAGDKPAGPFAYHGFYRHGKRVVFAYRLGGVEMLDAPWVEDGKFTRVVAPANEHPLQGLDPGRPLAVAPGPRDEGDARPGRALRDRHHRAPVREPLERPPLLRRPRLPARRLGLALHHAGRRLARHRARRDARTREVAAVRLGPAPGARAGRGRRENLRPRPRPDHPPGRPRRRRRGRFPRVRQQRLHHLDRRPRLHLRPPARRRGPLLHRLRQARRDPDLAPTARPSRPSPPASATPTAWASAPTASSPCPAPRGSGCPPRWSPRSSPAATTATGGPKGTTPPDLPLVYLPRGLDNSSGGQVFAASDRFGPLGNHWIHFSFGAGLGLPAAPRRRSTASLRGRSSRSPASSLSGVHRGRINPKDGQLYVSGHGRLGDVHPARRLLPARPLHRRARPAPRRLPRRRERRARHVLQARSTAPSPRLRDRSSPRPGTTATARATARTNSPRAIPACPATTPGRSARRTSSTTAGPSSSNSPTSSPSTSSTSTSSPTAATPLDLFATSTGSPPPFTGFPGYTPRPRRSPPTRSWPTWSPCRSSPRPTPGPSPSPAPGRSRIEAGKNLTFAPRTFTVKAGEPIKLTLRQPRRRPPQLGPDQARHAREGRRPRQQDHRRARRRRPPLHPQDRRRPGLHRHRRTPGAVRHLLPGPDGDRPISVPLHLPGALDGHERGDGRGMKGGPAMCRAADHP